MKMEEKRGCPACDNMFSGTMEFCPVCMLRKGLEVHVEPGESTSQVAFAFDFARSSCEITLTSILGPLDI
jgi:RNA polymerase subunit RPABC4/transcription elongation factor Spt4